jgi:hypothetical protein
MCNNKGSNSVVDGALALLPVSCPLVWQQQGQQCKQWRTTMTVVAAWTTMPWHYWLFLALSCDSRKDEVPVQLPTWLPQCFVMACCYLVYVSSFCAL